MILPTELASWLVFTIPITGALLSPVFAKIHGNVRDFMAVFVGFLTAFVAIDLLLDIIITPESIDIPLLRWIIVGDMDIKFGVLIDPLSVLLATIAGGIGSLIILYSVGYMTKHDEEGKAVKDPSLTRYYFFMQFFVGGMILLVMANNLLMTFIGWEIVGMCSYALIGFWHDVKEPSPVPGYESEGHYNAACGMKAFMVTRVGDVGLLAGILLLFFLTGTFNYTEILETAPTWIAELTSLTAIILPIASILIFAGPIGKSAQFPLHIWLPEAMAGPTTVSALIHAAAMVKAGVYLIARLVPIFIEIMIDVSGMIIFFQTVAYIGAFTAFMAATMALVQDEIKKVLAYSTISQLGYMFALLGASGLVIESVAAYAAAAYHLLGHAIFKGLLFLGAGSVLHAVQSKSMNDMGGLWRDMKVTAAAFTIGALALGGVIPTIGFWSKEMMFEALFFGGQYILFIFLFVTGIITAFYTFRMVGLTFFGEKSVYVKEMESHGHHIHESPFTMTIPLVALAGLAIVGMIFLPYFYQMFTPIGESLTHPFDWSYLVPFEFAHPLHSLLFTGVIYLGGMVPAYLIYFKGSYDLSRFRESTIARFLRNRWYINALFYRIFVDGYLRISNAFRSRVESTLLSFSEALSDAIDSISKSWRRTMTGILNTNILGMMIGIIAFLVILMLF